MPNSKKTVARRALFALLVAVTVLIGGVVISGNTKATAGINQRINFQGRLLTSQGATVPDGYYNIQFKVYQDGDGQTAGNTTGSPAGSLKWTESYLNANSQGVLVKNGYMSVELGSITAFGSSVDWNQDTLWLSINIGSTNGSCTPFSSCSPDGEMLPMRRFSATPYALNAGQLGGLTGSQFVQLAQGVQAEAGNNTSSIYLNKTGTGGNFLQLQSASTDVFTLSNSGDILLGNNANHSLSVATSGAGTVGRDLTVGAGTGGSGTGSAGGNLVLQGGAAGGTDGNGGNVTINAGAKTGTGTAGVVSIGTSNTSGITLGATTTVAANQNLTFASGSGSFDQSASTGTFKTGSGAVSLNGDTTVASGKGLTVTSGTTSLTGTTNINTTGSAATTIGSTSGGAVSITANAASNFTTNSGALTLQGSGGVTIKTPATTASSGISINTGNASAGASGNITLDVGTATTTTGTISIGTANASSVTIGSTTGNVIVQNGLTSGVSAGTGTFVNNGATKNTTLALGDLAAGVLGTAANTVDKYTSFTISPTASGRTYTIPAPTDGAAGRVIYISNINATNTFTIGSTTFSARSTATLVYDGIGWNFAGMDGGSNNYIQNQNAGAQTGNYWISGTARADTGVLTPSLDVASAGLLKIGGTTASTIQIGNTSLSSGTQTISIGTNNTAGGTTNVTIGNGASATAGSTTVQAKDNVSIATNGVTRATFNNTNTLYLGNGVTAAAPNNFTLSGTGSTTTAVAGGSLTIQGGNATVGNANGGNVTLTGGTGIGTGTTGLVILNTPTFSTIINDANCFPSGTESTSTTNCTITSSSVNSNSSVIVGFTNDGQTAFLPDPAILTAGRVVYITASNLTKDFTLSVNGGGQGNQIAMRKNTTATMIWNGADWTAAGASSSTTLQAAYDNTLQSAGGAELVVSKTSSTNGLTIRDSSVAPVNGTLLSVQSSSAANLFSVNGNVTEYVSNGGAETNGGTPTTFPANTWSALTGATVSRYNTAGNFIATGQGSVSVGTTTSALSGVKNQLSSALTAKTTYNVSFTARLASGTFTDLEVYYSNDGTTASTLCTNAKAVATSVWTKINCTFTAPASGITSSNALFIRQTGSGTARTFYVDNASVTIAADYNLATDGGVDDTVNFATNWPTAGLGTVSTSQNLGDGYNASSSATATVTTGAANAGIRNKLSINPLPGTLYRVSAYVKSSNTFNDFKIRYSRDGSTTAGGNYVDCLDYNTQSISTSTWTQITCYITTDGTAATNPYVYFVETASATRTFYVDAFSMTLASNSTPNVQIGGGVNGGPTTLFTLDKGASAPIAANNDALLGSMYYDTTLGKLQCYEADGWGACGSSPDNIVTISPEYTNAVLYGDGVGTMTSSLCSDALDINDATHGTSICGTNETYNFYRWTSPQATDQKYSIYVTYQLPSTFKSFNSGQTSVQGRVDNTTNAYVKMQIYKNQNSGGGLTACGGDNAVTTSANTWQAPVASGTADPSTCGFNPGDSIVFKITTGAKTNANAYVGNLNFSFNNR